MADNKEQLKLKEREIPVFTVLKNNCILKNIYLLDNPPSISSSLMEKNGDQESEMEEILVVGRHPDCNIKLEHPSISRFHLRILLKPSSRSLFVTDLSSVHGTWISGKRIESGVWIKLNEGDTLQLGGSSRLYRLHWVPLSSAYDVDKPFLPQLDAADTIEEETNGTIFQDENNSPYKNYQLQTLSDNLEGLEELYSDENLGSSMQTMSPSAPHMSEYLDSSFSNEEEVENKSSSEIYHQENEIPSIEQSQFHKENSTLHSPFRSEGSQMPSQIEHMETSGMKSEKKSGLSIWSRRGKPKSIQIDTRQSREKSPQVKSLVPESYETESNTNDNFASREHEEEEIFTPDKENLAPNSFPGKLLKGKNEKTCESILNIPLFGVDQEEEIFPSDKENMTPDTHLLKCMKNVGKLEEVKHPKSLYRSSPLKSVVNCNLTEGEYFLSSSDKENHNNYKTSKFLVREVTIRGGRSINYPKYEDTILLHNKSTMKEKMRWTIVVDTTCLLNEKSRKELQFLRGLKGTSLIIPRIVVRELDCMLRHGSFFRRTTNVTAALKWIEDCMENAKWWIHVQSSAEEGRLIPPTPPASPHWFSEDKSALSIGTNPFSPYSLQEIVTPTAEDHILECSLFFKRIRNNEQHVLISDDVTLKIKAMAEGVICETAEEFRGSLVNPFSERFLYTDSSPRGRTWSCADDSILKEKFYPSPSKKLSKSGREDVKGLKLILLHNSNFRQITPVN